MADSNDQFSKIMSAIKGLNEITVAAREDSRLALEGLRGLREDFEAYKASSKPIFSATSPHQIQPTGEAGRSSPGKNHNRNTPKKYGFCVKKRLDPEGHGYDWSTFLVSFKFLFEFSRYHLFIRHIAAKSALRMKSPLEH